MAEWYSQVVQKAELADYAPVKGCMIIRPRGYAIWENIQKTFDQQIKKLGVQNAYFPLFIPESFFKKEQQHAQGFTPEVAWIASEDMGERLAIRPTSETIIYDSYSKWIRSHRDLPLRINQWCNVVRWETEATKMFIRTREFLWQEGHCVYATEEECSKETRMFLEEYRTLCEQHLALPIIAGVKTKNETFAGADYTLTIESFMPDGKALQCGTSHNLGQGFADSFGIRFVGEDEKEHIPWQNSWGISTRLVGALVMMHGDDKGLIIPPKIAEEQVVIIPILFEKTKKDVLKAAKKLEESIKEANVFVDDRDEYTSGWKLNEWELKGVPIRLELGPRDLKNGTVVLSCRDTGEKQTVKLKDVNKAVTENMEKMQKRLFKKAKAFLDSNIVEVSKWEDFVKHTKNNKIVKTLFCKRDECEKDIKDKTAGITPRCIPFDSKKPKGKCVNCGKEAQVVIYFSRSY